jgi:hypothetical protein
MANIRNNSPQITPRKAEKANSNHRTGVNPPNVTFNAAVMIPTMSKATPRRRRNMIHAGRIVNLNSFSMAAPPPVPQYINQILAIPPALSMILHRIPSLKTIMGDSHGSALLFR